MTDIATNRTNITTWNWINGSFPYLQPLFFFSKDHNNATFLNTKYKKFITMPINIMHSLIKAIDFEEQSILSNAVTANTNTTITTQPFIIFQREMNYFFSWYSFACLLFALILNRIASMASTVRYNLITMTNKWNRFIEIALRLVAISFVSYIGYVFYNSLIIDNNNNNNNTSNNIPIYHFTAQLPSSYYLKLCYVAVSFSESIELLINTIYNGGKAPLSVFDYTIFDLTLLFYKIEQQQSLKTHSNMGPITIEQDSLVVIGYVLIAQITIHILEATRTRKKWLYFSTALNVLYIGYLISQLYRFPEWPTVVQFNSVPKLLSLLIVLVSLLCFGMACVVMGFSNLSSLQYYGFITNLRGQLNYTGEEDFYKILIKLTLFLSSFGDNANNSEGGAEEEEEEEGQGIGSSSSTIFSKKNSPLLQNNFGTIKNTRNDICGYKNRFDTIPDFMSANDYESDSFGTSNGSGTRASDNDRNSIIKWKIVICYRLIKNIPETIRNSFVKRKDISANNNNGKGKQKSPSNNKISDIDINEVITRKNYKYLFINDKIRLFPEVDSSPDYDPNNDKVSVDNDNSELDSICEGTESESELYNLYEDLLVKQSNNSIVDSQNNNGDDNDDDFSWDVWQILKFSQNRSTTSSEPHMLTRSKYMEMNESTLLKDMIKRKQLSNNNSGVAENIYNHEDPQLDDLEEQQYLCVVCRTNMKNIILWPCRCFALCDDCRISLGVRGFKNCCCCRTKIKGFSKVNNV
ncbi:uncharacterized protein SCODWIG_00032 [Saccharomycodes ludwigii]|uniref:Protein ASI3 n=1 Tax=Saccharomycodes ludwigii TaxID=36035 RepID=A0A376B0W0_9ASCO|nr:uncharacterized protein SCODWIG_00032 [Saccharomycodes ludwigii]